MIRSHISWYLREATGYLVSPDKICMEAIDVAESKSYIVILKDDIRRLQGKHATGALRQRQWSIFIFSYINAVQYEKCFGRNKKCRDIVSPRLADGVDSFSYECRTFPYKGKQPEKLYKSRAITRLLQQYLFVKLQKEYRYLFLNSYVYSVLTIVDPNLQLSAFGMLPTYYYNTNHRFDQVANKRVIQQKTDINLTTSMVEQIQDELEIIEKNYNDMTDLVRAYNGAQALNFVTEQNYTAIRADIDHGEQFIITEGMARTGKTVIALRLLGFYPQSRLIIMNPHFYRTLEEIFKVEGQLFPQDRIICHIDFDRFDDFITNAAILIVDEAQRLGEHQISSLTQRKNQCTVLLGDSLQKLNMCYDCGLDTIKQGILEHGHDFKQYYFACSLGLSSNVLYSIKYLLFPEVRFNQQSINQYEIHLFSNEKEFLSRYHQDETFRKHMSAIYMGFGDYSQTVSGFVRWTAKHLQSYHYFLDKDVKERVMLTTYELISRELDAIYIYLPNDVSANKEGLHYERGADEYLRNQIYVLMTRAKGSVWIYCENPSAYQYLSERCEKLIKRAEVRTPYDKEEEERCNALATLIEERGITRLVHFTAEENLPSIYDHGLMSVAKMDKSGIKYDNNDTDRADNIPDGISLSVQNPNQYLLKHFCQKYPNKKYVILSLDPALLYEIPDDSGKRMAPRFYCDYNAASACMHYSRTDMEIMFPHVFDGGSWVNTREGKGEDTPTANQAEILFCQTIDPKYILEVSEVDERWSERS